MRSEHSLQRRLGLGLTLGVTLLWLVAVAVSGLVVRYELNKVFDSALEETAQRILPLAVVEVINRDAATTPQRILPLAAHDEHLTYLVQDAAGNTLLHSHSADRQVFGNQPHTGFVSTPTHRIYGAAAVRETFWIQVAEPLAHRRKAALEVIGALLWPLTLLIPLSLAGTWWLVRNSLRRVRDYRKAITAKGAGDLSAVRAEHLPTEIEPIAVAVNQLLERLRRTLEAEQSFTANSAHELRTPLATALAQVQRLEQELPTGPQLDKARQIEATLRSLSRLSESLMQLAKAEGGRLLSDQPQDLVPVLVLVVDELRRNARVPIQLDLPEGGILSSTLDPDAFAILLRNLIDNALKHGAAEQPVSVRLAPEGILRVINAGPVVPTEALPRLRSRFVRATSDVPGSGLGLAIVDRIAAGAGATLQICSPASGRTDGFEVVFDFHNTVI